MTDRGRTAPLGLLAWPELRPGEAPPTAMRSIPAGRRRHAGYWGRPPAEIDLNGLSAAERTFTFAERRN